ncbi:MAG: Uma2 family endonuclease [Spirulinaceae cyanobacterium]
MTLTPTPPLALTLAEYLRYDDGREQAYELEQGALRAMPPESERNRRIAMKLLFWLGQQGVAMEQLSLKTDIVVAANTTRLPALMVLSPELTIALSGASRSTVMPEMPAPDLVVEVVSPGSKNSQRDYETKRSEYAARGIPEYWIIDPQQQQVVILHRVGEGYEAANFSGNATIFSPCWGSLPFTAAQLWATD